MQTHTSALQPGVHLLAHFLSRVCDDAVPQARRTSSPRCMADVQRVRIMPAGTHTTAAQGEQISIWHTTKVNRILAIIVVVAVTARNRSWTNWARNSGPDTYPPQTTTTVTTVPTNRRTRPDDDIYHHNLFPAPTCVVVPSVSESCGAGAAGQLQNSICWY